MRKQNPNAKNIDKLGQSMLITTFQNNITATIFSNGVPTYTADARCDPDDVFDFEFGACLAISRVFKLKKDMERKPVQIPKGWHKVEPRPLKKGDKVLVVNAVQNTNEDSGELYYCNGDILTIEDDLLGDWNDINIFDTDKGIVFAFEVIPIEKNAPKKTRYYTGDVICIANGDCDFWTVGRTYHFENGFAFVNNSRTPMDGQPVKKFEDFAKMYSRELVFIEAK